MKTRYVFPIFLERKIQFEARRLSKSPQDLVTDVIATSLANVIVSEAQTLSKCLCPPCPGGVHSRGVCPRHYMRSRWYMRKHMLNEGWLVRHGRLLPAKGLSFDDYRLPEGIKESLDTLPSPPPDLADDTLWVFGFPQAQSEREKLTMEESR